MPDSSVATDDQRPSFVYATQDAERIDVSVVEIRYAGLVGSFFHNMRCKDYRHVDGSERLLDAMLIHAAGLAAGRGIVIVNGVRRHNPRIEQTLPGASGRRQAQQGHQHPEAWPAIAPGTRGVGPVSRHRQPW